MLRFPGDPYYATETTFTVTNPAYWDIDPALEPMLQWCRDHNIDPGTVIAAKPITRAEGSITYSHAEPGLGADQAVERKVSVDGWPAPWPGAVKVTP